jgi:hypothetical protein
VFSPYELYIKLYNGKLPTENDPKYLELLNMSKYRILEVPDVHFAKCANCGATKNDGRKYVDFGLQVDFYGVVYLCGLCVKHIAFEMGLFDSLIKELAETKKQITDRADLQKLGDELYNSLLEKIEGFKEYHANLHSAGDNNSSNDGDSVGSSKESVEPKPNRTKSGSTKPNTSGGSEKLRSLAEILESGGSQ